VTLVRAKVEVNLPRKRGAAAAGYEKAITRFYEKVRCALTVVALRVVHVRR
jgi:protein pelota